MVSVLPSYKLLQAAKGQTLIILGPFKCFRLQAVSHIRRGHCVIYIYYFSDSSKWDLHKNQDGRPITRSLVTSFNPFHFVLKNLRLLVGRKTEHSKIEEWRKHSKGRWKQFLCVFWTSHLGLRLGCFCMYSLQGPILCSRTFMLRGFCYFHAMLRYMRIEVRKLYL